MDVIEKYFPYITTIVVIMLPFVLKESKYVKYIRAIQLVWMWILIGCCTHNVDTPGYKAVFDRTTFENLRFTEEFIYDLSCAIVNKMGLSYQNLVQLWALIFIMILNKGINKLTDSPEIVYSFFLIFPFLENVIQLKNFAGATVIVYGVHYLLKDDWREWIKYVLCVLISIMLHGAFAFYLILILVPIIRKKARLQVGYMVSLPLVLICAPVILDKLGRIVTTDAVVDSYMNNTTKITTLVILIVWQVAGVILTQYSVTGHLSYVISSKTQIVLEDMTEHEKKVMYMVLLVNICMLLVAPCYVVTPILQRLVKNVLVLNSVVYSLLWKYREKSNNIKWSVGIWGLYLLISAVAFYALTGGGASWMSNKMAIENNMFWN